MARPSKNPSSPSDTSADISGTSSECGIDPLFDRVVIRRVELRTTSSNTVLIPDSAKEKPQQGEVIAIGDGRITETGQRVPPSLAVGDIVIFGKYAGVELVLDGQEYLIIKEEDILVKLKHRV